MRSVYSLLLLALLIGACTKTKTKNDAAEGEFSSRESVILKKYPELIKRDGYILEIQMPGKNLARPQRLVDIIWKGSDRYRNLSEEELNNRFLKTSETAEAGRRFFALEYYEDLDTLLLLEESSAGQRKYKIFNRKTARESILCGEPVFSKDSGVLVIDNSGASTAPCKETWEQKDGRWAKKAE